MKSDLRAPSRCSRRAFSLVDLLIILFIVGLLIAILLPSLSRARELAKRAVCASNLRGLGQGCYIYGNDNQEWFPHHYFAPVEKDADPTEPHKVRWVGTMGTSESLSIKEATSPSKSPDASHPSRSVFLLVIGGLNTSGQYVCPSSADREDDMRVHGPDAGGNGSRAALPGKNRFDFLGYDRLSYSYQLPFGRRGKPKVNMDARSPLMADKGPYYEAGGPGLEGTMTTRDALSGRTPPVLEGSDTQVLEEIRPADRWRGHNSRSHRSEGQNVLFADGHADFVKTPFVGVNLDNLYTIQSDPAAGAIASIAGGIMPGAEQRLGPRTNTDSFLVP